MDYNDIYWKQDPSHPSDIFPGGAGLLRARRKRRARADRRAGAGARVRVPLLRGRVSRHSRARLASRHADRVRFADRRRARAASDRRADSARHRHLGLAARHARRGHRRQADDDEEHRGPDGDAVGRAGGADGGEGLHRPRARGGRQGRPHALLRAGVEAERADRRARRLVAHHAVRDEVLPHRGADARAHLGGARPGARARSQARAGGEGSHPFAGPRGRHPERSQQVRSAHRKKPPTIRCRT